MHIFYIYHLSNPKNGEIFYVGCTNNPRKRWLQHCTSPGNQKIRRYCDGHNIRPSLTLIDKIEVAATTGNRAPKEVRFLEFKWIKKLNKQGHKLLNKSVGYTVFADQIIYKVGNKITA